jgi:hypothetical protein
VALAGIQKHNKTRHDNPCEPPCFDDPSRIRRVTTSLSQSRGRAPGSGWQAPTLR